MKYWLGIAAIIIAIGCGGSKSDDSSGGGNNSSGGDEDAGADNPDTWRDEENPPEDLCSDWGDAVGQACSDETATWEEDACLNTYVNGYELNCLDVVIALVNCTNAESHLIICNDGWVDFNFDEACTEEAAAYTACTE
jgi:hypothetical protein